MGPEREGTSVCSTRKVCWAPQLQVPLHETDTNALQISPCCEVPKGKDLKI